MLHLAAALLLVAAPTAPQDDWPQGPGPRGDWTTDAVAPTHYSARTGASLTWRTPLPETGQGGIAVVADRVYVATMAPWSEEEHGLSEEDAKRFEHATEKRSVVGKEIDAHCLDRATGKVLWTRRLKGSVPAIYTYPFSDATSASPVANETHVWFTNAAGHLACFTKEGELAWERRWMPAYDGPFNKQFEPFLVRDGERDVFIHMEPFAAEGAEGDHGRWHHLVGLDAKTGEELWHSLDALTQYNAPTLARVALAEDAEPEVCALIGRGGPHAVPERPVGVSLVRLTGTDAGKSAWRYDDPRGNHEASLQTMAHDGRHAFWILKEPRNALVVLDLATGAETREISLVKDVTVTRWDAAKNDYVSEEKVTLERGVFPARYSLAASPGRAVFQCYATAWGKPTIGPPYSYGRVDIKSSTVEYLEVPTDVERAEDGAETRLWRTKRLARPVNSRGVEVTGDDRCRWDGWDWVFNGSPTVAGGLVHHTLVSGVTYILDPRRERFDGDALVSIGDVGPAGDTWTANSVSICGGSLFHRTGREILRFDAPR